MLLNEKAIRIHFYNVYLSLLLFSANQMLPYSLLYRDVLVTIVVPFVTRSSNIWAWCCKLIFSSNSQMHFLELVHTLLDFMLTEGGSITSPLCPSVPVPCPANNFKTSCHLNLTWYIDRWQWDEVHKNHNPTLYIYSVISS